MYCVCYCSSKVFSMNSTKVVTLESLDTILTDLRQKGKTIVTTNGSFDILHIGHIRYLQESRKLGDVLVVGINSDASVKSYKGPKRPINAEAERAEALVALSCVDYVVIFFESVPDRVLEVARPHIHTKGGDYDLSQIPERELIESMGGTVVVLPLTKGFSTTALIERIFSAYKE